MAQTVHRLGAALRHPLVEVEAKHVEIGVAGAAHALRDAEKRPDGRLRLASEIRIVRILAGQHQSLNAGPVAVDVGVIDGRATLSARVPVDTRACRRTISSRPECS